MQRSLKLAKDKILSPQLLRKIAQNYHPRALVRLALQNYALRRGLPSDIVEVYLKEMTTYAVARARVLRANMRTARKQSDKKGKRKRRPH